jgi:serine/threonine protein kinase
MGDTQEKDEIQRKLEAALSLRYDIERPLGEGGMAFVFLGKDVKHERQVAIKVLKPELAAVLGAERFVQEIKTTAALSHPHILPPYDSGRTGGRADGRNRHRAPAGHHRHELVPGTRAAGAEPLNRGTAVNTPVVCIKMLGMVHFNV